MTFGQCIELWKKHPGKAFRRAEWPEECFVEFRGPVLWFQAPDIEEQFMGHFEDLFATDWEEC